jgi:hypothetical protein
MRIALYARVSTKDKGQDTENQLLQLRQFCKEQGWVIAGEYVDQKTGRTSDREAFQRLFQHAYEKRYDLCLFCLLASGPYKRLIFRRLQPEADYPQTESCAVARPPIFKYLQFKQIRATC